MERASFGRSDLVRRMDRQGEVLIWCRKCSGYEVPNEEGDVVKEFKAMHEEDFWSSWLREDERGKVERMAKKTERKEEEKGEKRKRKVE